MEIKKLSGACHDRPDILKFGIKQQIALSVVRKRLFPAVIGHPFLGAVVGFQQLRRAWRKAGSLVSPEAGTDFEVISQDRENGWLRQGAHGGKI